MLAAGEARRFGSAKQVAEVEGRPLVQHAVDALVAGGVDDVVVVLGANADLVEAALLLPAGARVVRNADFAEGQSTSLRAGTLAAGDADAVVVVLADQPGVGGTDVRAVVERWRREPAGLVRATYRGVPGHPVLIARERFPEVLALTGDVGARGMFGTDAAEIPLDREPPPDVDTPDDLAAVRDRAERDGD